MKQKPIISYINDFCDYCEIEKGLSQTTIANYRRFLGKFISWLKEEKKESVSPAQLTPDDIWNFRLYLSRIPSPHTKKPLSVSAQIRYLIALRCLLGYLVERNIPSLPPEKIKLPKEKEKTVKFLTIKQIERLLLAPNIKTKKGLRDRAILETLFSTGMRVSELVALNREQIDAQIHGDMQDFLELPIVGKGNAPRTVYFSPRSLFWIQEYLKKRIDTDPALFIRFRGKKSSSLRLTTRSVENIVKLHAARAGLSLIATPHTIRHSYATDLLSQGADLRSVQELLGHKNIVTTQIYTHVVSKQLKEAHKKYHSGTRLKE